ncbi:UDP-N-acetyl-D-galactosamine dehydrogenase [Sphingobacterium alimentarium]|uniref:UDP-N-acetyl-D-galactosamine dehydrogenase n=1 Tax=Sphingobacterium alimentarium TaxID=797292 RepID=A0A4R3VW82_9SPHI|nr:nucleotide sugar dehydrogenase [Sphingobacterium alimentarium]TCV10483.1 UDP-N-acetyl-D-galactosamine dehydrogenase [Sphingobacterium alimentarium]
MLNHPTVDNRLDQIKLAIVGLGYVGLPLAVEFAKKYPVIGFDINNERINELKNTVDITKEVEEERLKEVQLEDSTKGIGLQFSSSLQDLTDCNTFIVTVPTPIDNLKLPDLRYLRTASKMLAGILKPGDLIIYESTVYPGCTEEECVPILEQFSGLMFNRDFFVGYSPERINPGDKIRTLPQIKKVTSGSTAIIADRVDDLYRSIIIAGTHKAPSIKVAEASKAIENAQRDVNISFVNELALIFDRLGIDTNDVLEAAGTKWNFLKYKPGLVGGHCIGVDPYYLTFKAQSVGYHPQVILSGRRVNDNMGSFIAGKLVKMMIQKDIPVKHAKVLILGITFKENCTDIRNTRVVDIYKELLSYEIKADVYDPWVNKEEVKKEYNIDCLTTSLDIQVTKYAAIVLAVAHNEFLSLDIKKLKENKGIIFDIKSCLDRDLVDARL